MTLVRQGLLLLPTSRKYQGSMPVVHLDEPHRHAPTTEPIPLKVTNISSWKDNGSLTWTYGEIQSQTHRELQKMLKSSLSTTQMSRYSICIRWDRQFVDRRPLGHLSQSCSAMQPWQELDLEPVMSRLCVLIARSSIYNPRSNSAPQSFLVQQSVHYFPERLCGLQQRDDGLL